MTINYLLIYMKIIYIITKIWYCKFMSADLIIFTKKEKKVELHIMKKISLLFSSILASSLLMAVPSFADSSQILTESSQNSVDLIKSSVGSNPISISDLLIMPRAVNGYWNIDITLNKEVKLSTFTITEKSTVGLLVTQKRTGGTAPSINKPRLYYHLTSSSGNGLTPRDVYGDTTNEYVAWTYVLPGTYTLSVYMPPDTGDGVMTASTTGNVYTTPSN